MVSGVRILLAPDAAGDFDFERATRQIGEAASASFLAPHRREERTQDAGRDSPTTVSADPDPRAGYEGFLNDIVAIAQRFGFELKESPGRHEPRLRGLRQRLSPPDFPKRHLAAAAIADSGVECHITITHWRLCNT